MPQGTGSAVPQCASSSLLCLTIQSPDPTSLPQFTTNSPEGYPSVRHPAHLQLHHALEEVGFTGIDELNFASSQTSQAPRDPVLITPVGTILAGFGRWRLALLEGRKEIQCIEYSVGEDEALQFILTHNRPHQVLNDFVRIRLALTLEPNFQHQGIENMRAGGKYKGSANLPEAQCIEVRKAIAAIAGVGSRNVSNVKTILNLAHPRLIDALQSGLLSINSAMALSRLPRAEQLESFILFNEERAITKAIHRSILHNKEEKIVPDAVKILEALLRRNIKQPGSVVLKVTSLQHTAILVGRDVLKEISSQRELELR